MQNKYLYCLRLALVISDCLILNLSFFAALNFNVYRNFHDWKYSYFMVILIWMMSTTVFKLYQHNPINNFKGTVWATIQSAFIQILIFWIYVNFIGDYSGWNFLFVFTAIMLLAFIVSRYVFSIAEPRFKKIFGPKKPISIFEFGSLDRHLAPYINNFALQHQFEGYAHQPSDELYKDSEPEVPGYDRFFKYAFEKGLNEVYISLPSTYHETTTQLQKEADKHGIRLKLIYNYDNTMQLPALTNLGNVPVLSLRKEPLDDISNVVTKRLFDILFSSLVIIMVLSWLYPIVAILIICESKGPVIFKQMRNGLNGRKFACYKFRSMRVNQLCDTIQAGKNDNRITTIGRFLRKTSLDELPQFINVLLGDMSVVGPRPHMLKHTEQYRTLIDNYMVRHYLKPGITGWAQVNGFRGETQTLMLMQKRVEHDIWYIENWSVSLDIEIICRTVINIFKGENNAF
ncbi:undecaprenyl-phosphate glucose phosphotransferase [Mucilaginibacter litoreus]|uniref:Undecaprenyl-phosphate glucose phosphotransferase n=1 Tax=Mucilaginibacter litoreus TaxID=1048221 RepID=A0ABW3ALY3_9SPHI